MKYFKGEGNKKIMEFLDMANEDDDEEVLFKKFKRVFGKNPEGFIRR